MGTLLLVLVILFLYFIPTLVAYSRKKGNRVAILALNFFLGWSLIGWVIALVWAYTNEPKS